MTSAITNYAAKKLLGKQMEKYKLNEVCGIQDPYFAEVVDKRGKKRKVKKQIPDFIPDHDAKVLAKVKKTAYRLDMSLFNFLGMRFGWSSVIGIIPAAGDAIDTILAVNLVRTCGTIEGGLPSSIYTTMIINIILDFIVGLIPFLGDLLDAAFKANTRNVALLENHLIKKHMPAPERERRKKNNITEHPGLEPFPEDADLLPAYSQQAPQGRVPPGQAQQYSQGHAQQYSQGSTPQYSQGQSQQYSDEQPLRQNERSHLEEAGQPKAKKWYTFGRS